MKYITPVVSGLRGDTGLACGAQADFHLALRFENPSGRAVLRTVSG